MTKKILLFLLFFIIAPLTLSSIFLFPSFLNTSSVLGESTVNQNNIVFSSTPETESSSFVSSQILAQESVPILISNYLKRYDSPLYPFSNLIIDYSKKYSVDPRLIVAIAQQESNLGKKSPDDCFNAWGWGIHKNGTKCYNNWPEAIESVIMGISKDYCAKGYCEDPCVMMKKYTPSSNGSWCFGINQFLAELQSGDF
jgi:hypothetical protein